MITRRGYKNSSIYGLEYMEVAVSEGILEQGHDSYPTSEHHQASTSTTRLGETSCTARLSSINQQPTTKPFIPK
jgi:hypothetical protein